MQAEETANGLQGGGVPRSVIGLAIEQGANRLLKILLPRRSPLFTQPLLPGVKADRCPAARKNLQGVLSQMHPVLSPVSLM